MCVACNGDGRGTNDVIVDTDPSEQSRSQRSRDPIQGVHYRFTKTKFRIRLYNIHENTIAIKSNIYKHNKKKDKFKERPSCFLPVLPFYSFLRAIWDFKNDVYKAFFNWAWSPCLYDGYLLLFVDSLSLNTRQGKVTYRAITSRNL